MGDSHQNIFYNNNQQDIGASHLLDDVLTPKLNYSNAKYQIDMTNSTSLPTSPSRDNIVTINCLQHISGSSLSNSFDNISRDHMVSEIEFLSTNDINNGNISLKPQSSFNSNMLMINQKRKKSNLFSSTNNYRNKVETFTKIFGDTEAITDQLLADFSCALVKNSHSILLQGRLYITERWICFYSKIMSFENKIVLPINGITNVSKEKTARVIPNAIQITTETGKYFFTSFGSREKTFNVLLTLWQNFKDRKLKDISKLGFGKDVDETGEAIIPSFVVGDESDTDTEPSLYSSNFNPTDEPGEKAVRTPRSKKKVRPNRPIIDKINPEEFLNRGPGLMHSLNVSNTATRPLNRVHSQPNLGKRMQSQSCSDHEHFQKFYLDEEFDMHVDKLFNCLFTHSSFFKRFCEFRKTYDVVQASWPEDYCDEGLKERTIYYTLTLKAKIGPKISASEEKQIVHNNSQQGFFYMVDTEVRNSGFPLADCFHSVNRYCIIHVSGFKSRLKVSSEIVYDKSLFFASKSLIESTAKSGLTDYFSDLGNALKHEARSPVHQLNVNHNHGPAPVISDVKRCPIVPPPDTQHKINIPINDPTTHTTLSDHFSSSSGGFMRADRAWFLLIVLSLILCLCLSFLYSRFRQLEEITNIQISRQHQNKFESVYDWKEMLQHQHQHQLDELSQWKILVDNSIDLIDQMKNVLVIIKGNLDKLSQEIKSNPVQFSNKPNRGSKSL